jgi:hypothetical protein
MFFQGAPEQCSIVAAKTLADYRLATPVEIQYTLYKIKYFINTLKC